MLASALANGLHTIAAVLWVGGMFFAYMVLRPVAGALEPPQRLRLWKGVFDRFFPWVWAAVFILPASGYWAIMVDFGGFANAGIHVHIMHAIAIVMIGLFVYLFGGPYRGLVEAVAGEDWPTAGGHLAAIRRIVATNLILGLITTAVGSSGRFW